MAPWLDGAEGKLGTLGPARRSYGHGHGRDLQSDAKQRTKHTSHDHPHANRAPHAQPRGDKKRRRVRTPRDDRGRWTREEHAHLKCHGHHGALPQQPVAAFKRSALKSAHLPPRHGDAVATCVGCTSFVEKALRLLEGYDVHGKAFVLTQVALDADDVGVEVPMLMGRRRGKGDPPIEDHTVRLTPPQIVMTLACLDKRVAQAMLWDDDDLYTTNDGILLVAIARIADDPDTNTHALRMTVHHGEVVRDALHTLEQSAS